jgi:hypothetical protein
MSPNTTFSAFPSPFISTSTYNLPLPVLLQAKSCPLEFISGSLKSKYLGIPYF